MKHLTLEEKLNIIKLYEEDKLSQSRIATLLNRNRKTISKIIKECKLNKSLPDRKKRELYQKLSHQDIVRILDHVEQNPEETTKEIIKKLNLNSCLATFNKILKRNQIKTLTRINKAILTDEEKQNRLNFARQYQHLTIDDWKNCLFVDESYLQNKNNYKELIKCKSNEQYHPNNYSPKNKRKFKLNFVAFCSYNYSKLYKFDGYCNELVFQKFFF